MKFPLNLLRYFHDHSVAAMEGKWQEHCLKESETMIKQTFFFFFKCHFGPHGVDGYLSLQDKILCISFSHHKLPS